MNNKASLAEDLACEIEILKKRLCEAEECRDCIKKENECLEAEKCTNEEMRCKQLETIAQLEKDRCEFEKKFFCQEKLITQQNHTNDTLKCSVSTLEDQCKSLNCDLEKTMCQKTKLQGELDTATEYIIAMEEKVYKSNKISLDLLE